MGAAGEIGLLNKSMAHGTQQAIGSVIGKGTSKVWGYQLGLSSKNLFRQEGR